MFVMPRYTERGAREAVAVSWSYTEALRRLRLRAAGGNHALFRKWVDDVWRMPTDHFDPYRRLRGAQPNVRATPLEEILVEHSSYQRGRLKRRLYEAGLKRPICEICGQDENWRSRKMALILDHINGVPDDNRLDNLRIVCPNCSATFDTHRGRKNVAQPVELDCARCGKPFVVKRPKQRYCSRACGIRWDRRERMRGVPIPQLRRVERPPYERLLREIEETSYVAVGRRYGVTDNAIRKWVRQYERERELGLADHSGDLPA